MSKSYLRIRKGFPKNQSARCPTGGKYSLECRTNGWRCGSVSQWLADSCFPLVDTGALGQEQTGSWALPAVTHGVLFTEHTAAAVRGETGNKASPPAKRLAGLIQGLGFETSCVLSGFHSAVIHVRMRFQGRNIQSRQPHMASKHLCLLCCLGKRETTLQKPVALPEDTSNTR